eukprot:2575931-Prymnesium_polylepis.1
MSGRLKDAVDKQGLWPEEAQPHLPELSRLADRLLDASYTPTSKLELLQLFHGADRHEFMLYDNDAVKVISGSLYTSHGDEFRPLRLGSE